MITYTVFHRADCDIHHPKIMNNLHAVVITIEAELKTLINLEFYAVSKADKDFVALFFEGETSRLKRDVFEKDSIYLVKQSENPANSGLNLKDFICAEK